MKMAHVHVKTRPRPALSMEADSSAARTHKRRKKLHNKKHQPRDSTATKSQRNTSSVTFPEEPCRSPTSDEVTASCCSSNGSVRPDEERIKVLDLEVESAQVETSTCNGGDEIEIRKEMNNSSEPRENSQEPESMETDSRRPSSNARIAPPELELEEFFTAAEKDIQKRFQEKYNYDIVKDVPLDGRYEWVQLKP